jgi:hypothetical protein
MQRRPLFVFMVMIVVSSISTTDAQSKIPIPPTGCYHAAFTPYTQDSFETLAGKSIAIELIYRSWKGSPDFDQYSCDKIVANGAYPCIAWEPWDGSITSTAYSLQSIIDGTHDALIQRWATGIKQWKKPLLLRWAHEMNGDWYPWDGFHNGGETLAGYGDPAKPDGPERYVDAYRHIRHVFDSIGVPNISWVWCPNVMWDVKKPLNNVANYFPGSDAVDWIGMNCYNWGTAVAGMSWKSAEQMFRLTYTGVVALADKPILVGESASTETGGDKAAWITETFKTIKSGFPKIKLFTWFNENKETDWRINSSPAALAAYRAAIADPYFISLVPSPVKSLPRVSKTGPVITRRRHSASIILPAPQSMTIIVSTLRGCRLAEIQDHAQRADFDFTPYPAGTYLLQVRGDGLNWCERIVIDR